MPSADALAATAVRLQEVREILATAGLSSEASHAIGQWLDWSAQLIAAHRPREAAVSDAETGTGLAARLELLAERAYGYAMEMDFRFLFDDSRKLFAIGFQQSSHLLDGSFYDLLASEARLASFIAIAKNDAPIEHWFRLDRTLTHAAGETALVSWSGSMFPSPCSTRPCRARWGGRLPTAPSAGSRGASVKVPTTSATGI